MLKLVAIGIWVIIVTAGATLASVYLAKGGEDGETGREDRGVEELASELTSIPVIRGGEVTGYLILQLSFAADKALLEEKKLDPLPYLKDAAFRVIFTGNDVDFRRLKPSDLDRLTDTITHEANRRLGSELVRNVLFQQLNYVKKEDIRTNWISGDGPAD